MLCEDYLGVAPILPGDSVIIMNEVVLKQYICCDLENKKGGTADIKVIRLYPSLAFSKGFFCITQAQKAHYTY